MRLPLTTALIAGALACVPEPTPSTPHGVDPPPVRAPERPEAPPPTADDPPGPWPAERPGDPQPPASPVPEPVPGPLDAQPLPAPWPAAVQAVAGVEFERTVLADEDVVGFAVADGALLAGTATGGLFRVEAPGVWRPRPTTLPPLRALFDTPFGPVACPADGGNARIARDGARWSRLDLPCGADGRRTIAKADDAAWVLTPAGRVRPLLGGEALPVDVPDARVLGAARRTLVVLGAETGAVSIDGGLTFEPTRRPSPAVAEYRDVALTGKGRAVAVGRAHRDRPGIEFSTDAGRTWLPAIASDRLTADLAAVAVDSRGVFYATPRGDGSAVFSEDGGETWSPLDARGTVRGPVFPAAVGALAGTPRGVAVGLHRQPPRGPGLDRPLWRAVFTHPRVGVAVGVLGGLWRTVDGGRRWSAVPGTDSLPFTDLDRLTGHVVVAVGEGLFRRTEDAGRRWIAAPPPGSCQARWVRFTGERGVAECGDGRPALSVDGGRAWARLTPAPARSPVAWIDDRVGAVLYDGGRMGWTTDGGLSFTAEPTPAPMVELVAHDGLSGLAADGTVWRAAGPGEDWSARPVIGASIGPAVAHRPLLDGRVALVTADALYLRRADGRIDRVGPAPDAVAVTTPGDGSLLVLQRSASTLFGPR